MRRCSTPAVEVTSALCALMMATTLLVGCSDEGLVEYRRQYKVVDGSPVVGEGTSAADYREPEVDPDSFTYGPSIRVDVFQQSYVRKVDILWMVDNSPSMVDVQRNLEQNFASFIRDLAEAEPAVDYQIGVITTDTLQEAGALREIEGHPGTRFIACNSPDFQSECNIGSLGYAQQAFRDTVAVGASGDPVERGLLAVHMALSEPMISTKNAGFLRDDAALYVIVVSDEGDLSCDPILFDPPSGDYRECTTYPDCRCADEENLVFGTVEYFVRFLNGLKGYGKEELVSVAAIVGDDSEELRLCWQPAPGAEAVCGYFTGCENPNIGERGMHAVFAPRYTEVAQRTGGIAVSICEEDYSGALEELGFRVSGLRRDFALSRVPVDPEDTPFRVTMITEEDGHQVRTSVPHVEDSADGTGWNYVPCRGAVAVNYIEFDGRWVPPPLALIEVVYTVDAGGVLDCN